MASSQNQGVNRLTEFRDRAVVFAEASTPESRSTMDSINQGVESLVAVQSQALKVEPETSLRNGTSSLKESNPAHATMPTEE